MYPDIYGMYLTLRLHHESCFFQHEKIGGKK